MRKSSSADLLAELNGLKSRLQQHIEAEEAALPPIVFLVESVAADEKATSPFVTRSSRQPRKPDAALATAQLSAAAEAEAIRERARARMAGSPPFHRAPPDD